MSIVTPEVYSYKDIDPIVVYGESVISKGLYVRSAINGYGIVSLGLLWQLYDIWIQPGVLNPISTTWSTPSSQSITTTWTRSLGGVFGDYQL